jgi:putative ABC transport system permease protein
VCVAIIIATPLAWWAMSKWLEGLHIESYFVVGVCSCGSLALLIALVTVSFQAIKAAIANPVQS